MNVRFVVDKKSMTSVKKFIEKSLASITEQVALKTYNHIVDPLEVGSYPYYTGSYISSWKITTVPNGKNDAPNKEYNPSNVEAGHYARPSIIYDIGTVLPYEKIIISNYSPHSYKVEYMGTPKHSQQGWYVANHAVNNTVMTYKFSFGT